MQSILYIKLNKLFMKPCQILNYTENTNFKTYKISNLMLRSEKEGD